MGGFHRTHVFDALGRVSRIYTSMTGHQGEQTEHYQAYIYDQHSRIKEAYDAARTEESFDSNGVRFVYDTDHGFISKIVDAQNASAVYFERGAVDLLGNITAYNLGNAVIQVNLAYDINNGRPLSQSVRAGALAVHETSYRWSPAGKLEGRAFRYYNAANTELDFDESFFYTGTGELRRYEVEGSGEYAVDLEYSEAGRLKFKSGVGQYRYGDQANYYAVTSTAEGGVTTRYQYDSAGQMIQSGNKRLSYTNEGYLKSATDGTHTVQFFYGPDGARYKRVDTAQGMVTTTLYIGGVEKVYRSNGTVTWRRGISGYGQVIHEFDSAGRETAKKVRYFVKDHLGSIVAVIDQGATIVDTMAFDPWGKRRNQQNWQESLQSDNRARYSVFASPATHLGFTGHEMIDDLGLIHMNGRVFDPHLAKFTSADPVVQDPSDGRSHDRYAYGMHSPLGGTDPSGYVFDEIFSTVNKWLGDAAPVVAIAIWFIPAVGQYASAGMLEAASVGFVTGGIASGSLKGAAIGAFSAAAGAAVGGNTGAGLFSAEGARQLAIYGVIGGALSVMQGGKFGHGFVTAGLTRAATTALSGFETTATIGGVDMGQVAAHAVVGGTISDVTGGKFANGAVTGGFQSLFTQLKSSTSNTQRKEAASMSDEERQHLTATKAVNKYMGRSVKENREYGGLIYRKEDGSYDYSVAEPGPVCNPGVECDVDAYSATLPSGAEAVAAWHTHPRSAIAVFSPADIDMTNSTALSEPNLMGTYLGSYDGNVYYYRAGTTESSHGYNILPEHKIRRVSKIVGRSFP